MTSYSSPWKRSAVKSEAIACFKLPWTGAGEIGALAELADSGLQNTGLKPITEQARQRNSLSLNSTHLAVYQSPHSECLCMPGNTGIISQFCFLLGQGAHLHPVSNWHPLIMGP